MNIPSKEQIESEEDTQSKYDEALRWLKATYGNLKPERFIDFFNYSVVKIPEGNKHRYVGTLKPEFEDIGPMNVSLICTGGYDHMGGKCDVFKDGSFYLMVVTA